MKSIEDIREALTPEQRRKRKQSFKKNKAKIMAARKRSAKKKASTEKLMGRAEAGARKAVEKKILKGRTKKDLSYAEREKLEKKVAKKKGAIKRIAKKTLPEVRKKEKERLAKRNKQEDVQLDEAKNQYRRHFKKGDPVYVVDSGGDSVMFQGIVKEVIPDTNQIEIKGTGQDKGKTAIDDGQFVVKQSDFNEDTELTEASGVERAIYYLKGSGIQRGRPAFDGSVKVKPDVEKDLWEFVEENQHVTIEDIQFYEGDTESETMIHFIGAFPYPISDWKPFTKELQKFDRRITLERYV